MRGVAFSAHRHRGADPGPVVFPIEFRCDFFCELLFASNQNHALTCRFRKPLSSFLAGGFQWEE
jgi:hypothetical protein